MSSPGAKPSMKMQKKRRLPKPRNYCFGCGPYNRTGMKLEFALDEETGLVRGIFHSSGRYRGSQDSLHGGIIATLMDEAMGKLNRLDRIVAPTAELSVEYLKPVRLERKIVVEARATRQLGRNYWRESTVSDTDGTLLACGKARFVKIADQDTGIR